MREFVLKAIGLKIGQSEPLGEKDRARLNLDASGTRVEFKAADGKDLGVFTVGRKYFKREVENPAKAIPDGRFVALPGEAGTAYLVGDALGQAAASSAEWIDRTAFRSKNQANQPAPCRLEWRPRCEPLREVGRR